MTAANVSRKRGVVLLLVAATVLTGRTSSATGDDRRESRLFLRLAVGPAFNYESWSPEGGSPAASYTGWGPALDIALGRRVRRGLVVAGDLQLAGIIDRSESYLGGSYSLADTLHFVDTVSGLVDYTSWSLPRVHVGGGVGLMAETDVDTHIGVRRRTGDGRYPRTRAFSAAWPPNGGSARWGASRSTDSARIHRRHRRHLSACCLSCS